jgi:hypothetical protein
LATAKPLTSSKSLLSVSTKADVSGASASTSSAPNGEKDCFVVVGSHSAAAAATF